MSQTSLDAQELLRDLNLYSIPVDPIVVCKKLDIYYQEAPYENFDGLLLVNGADFLVGVNSNILEPGRKAFTCAHEIGHVYYDAITTKNFRCTRNDVGYGKTNSDPIEIRANEFASELLLPRDLFLAEIHKKDPSWELLKNLSTKFRASLQATASRFVKLTHHACWLVVVKDGAIQRFTKADYNNVIPQVNRTFKPPAKDPGKFQETLADFWFYESRKTKNKKVKFWPLPINRYGECPILLWNVGNTLLNDEYIRDEFDDEAIRVDDDVFRRGRW